MCICPFKCKKPQKNLNQYWCMRGGYTPFKCVCSTENSMRVSNWVIFRVFQWNWNAHVSSNQLFLEIWKRFWNGTGSWYATLHVTKLQWNHFKMLFICPCYTFLCLNLIISFILFLIATPFFMCHGSSQCIVTFLCFSISQNQNYPI